jgi:hypothetical protein
MAYETWERLPGLVSHIQPKFTIFDARRKLLELDELSSLKKEYQKMIDDNLGIALRLSKISTLYSAWTASPPLDSLDDESYNDPNVGLASDDDGSGYDDRINRTKSGREDEFRPRTRSVVRAERGRGDGRPSTRGRAAKKRKVLAATHKSATL